MDLWLVAAAAGAGYLAKYWQNLSGDKSSLSRLCSGDPNFGKSESPDYPFRRLDSRKKLRDHVSSDRTVSDKELSDLNSLDAIQATEVASTSGIQSEKLGSLRNYQDFNVLSISNLQTGLSGNEDLQEGGNRLTGDVTDNHDDLLASTGEMGSFTGPMMNRSSLRSRRSHVHFIKPVSSLESCVMAQLYKEHAEMKEYVLSALPSPSAPTLRSLFVTDGNKIINRANDNLYGVKSKLHKDTYLQKNEIVCGVPPLPELASLDIGKKMQTKRGKGGTGKLGSKSKMANGKHFLSQGGTDSSEKAILLCLGISIGIISSFVANKREVDKLKDLLKQTENLVQDLHEELEMRDSLTVKELVNENYDSQDTCDNPIHERTLNLLSSEQNIGNSPKYNGRDSYYQKAEESSESLSKIEAELEAELERLGVNVNASALQRRLPDLVELDPEFVADFAQGELRVDMIKGQAVDQPKSNPDETDPSTTCHSGNYAVSPRELSLRLHEVIQSRLEERIDELEAALQNSERKVHLMESEHKNRREFSNNELRWSSSRENSFSKEECITMTQPIVMNLSGEALDAYNEAYEELMKTSESEEEDSPCRVYENILGSHSLGCVMFESQSERINASMPHSAIIKEKSLGELLSHSLRMPSEEQISWVQKSNDSSDSRDEISDFDDEMEKELIKQIVEKTKKGSPVVLNAQKLLFSVDEHEH
ncbi:uncharacterized protein LOC107418941 isoform X1 [Ziziphus jujuba]|uniref:Uncharacterized protein LOC107418941 isoform X1 n=1 Tax=Ziziphus jujuba TaxID=326968 RepID=A0A6P3ZTW8_ZIZJJ|nr:uncharacterized protein LOC107418941 isoform X1 [Ziziphus jujuba]